MYGKAYASMYTGSMIGAGSPTFAVWGYVIANMKPDKEHGMVVELNPVLLAFILGDAQEVVGQAIEKLMAPDPRSKSKEQEGRRLIQVGQFDYWVVNGLEYQRLRNEDERREYNRTRQSTWREKEQKKAVGALDPGKYHKDSREVLAFLNEKTGKAFREVDANLGLISSRLNEAGIDVEGVKKMIVRQCARWPADDRMREYLRPETLFGKSKFDGYYAAKDQPVNQDNGRRVEGPEPREKLEGIQPRALSDNPRFFPQQK